MKSKRIFLFVEFEGIRGLLKRGLEQKGYTIYEATDIDKAKEVLQNTVFEMAIVDADNREGAGPKIIDKMRDVTTFMFTPVILLVSGDPMEYAEMKDDLKIAQIFKKPFDMTAFYKVIERMVK